MKVLFIINDLSGGGGEKVLQLLARFLLQDGLAVKVVTIQAGDAAYQLERGLERIVLRTGRAAVGAGKIVTLPLQAWELSRILRKWQPDVCVSHLPRSNIVHVMTRWFGNRAPILITEHVATSHAYPSRHPVDAVMRFLVRTFYPKADTVFAVSDGVAQGLRAFGVVPERLQVVYNPVSVADIQDAARKSAPPEAFADDAPTVITVGRHSEQKDQQTLLEAFARVCQKQPARLILIGEGPLRGALGASARQLGIEDSVTFVGWQDNPFAWMARADLFVLSSKYEGFGNVLVEAMACGVPVVSTDCPSGPREILRDGDAGLLVPVGDVDGLSAAILCLLEDEALRKGFARKGQLRAMDFDVATLGPRYRVSLESCRREGDPSITTTARAGVQRR